MRQNYELKEYLEGAGTISLRETAGLRTMKNEIVVENGRPNY